MEKTPAIGLNAAIAAELTGARASARLTLDDVVAVTTISRSSLIRLEHATRDITMLDIAQLCTTFQIEPEELMRRAQARLERQ